MRQKNNDPSFGYYFHRRPKKAQGALNDGYMMTIQPFVLSEADFNPCCFPTGVIIYILHKIKEKRPEDPMWLVDNEVPY